MRKRRDNVAVNPRPIGVREPPGVAPHHEPAAHDPNGERGGGLHLSAEIVIELAPHEYPHVRALIGCGL